VKKEEAKKDVKENKVGGKSSLGKINVTNHSDDKKDYKNNIIIVLAVVVFMILSSYLMGYFTASVTTAPKAPTPTPTTVTRSQDPIVEQPRTTVKTTLRTTTTIYLPSENTWKKLNIPKNPVNNKLISVDYFNHFNHSVGSVAILLKHSTNAGDGKIRVFMRELEGLGGGIRSTINYILRNSGNDTVYLGWQKRTLDSASLKYYRNRVSNPREQIFTYPRNRALDMLQKTLSAGYPVLVPVDYMIINENLFISPDWDRQFYHGHTLVVVGYDKNGFKVKDPNPKARLKNYNIPYSLFMNAWGNEAAFKMKWGGRGLPGAYGMIIIDTDKLYK